MQNGGGMKMQGLQEGRGGSTSMTTHIFITAPVLHFLPALNLCFLLFILMWETFLSLVEVLAFEGYSFLSFFKSLCYQFPPTALSFLYVQTCFATNNVKISQSGVGAAEIRIE